MNKVIEKHYKVTATEPLYNIIHIWNNFVIDKAEDMALNLSTAGWRNIRIKEEQ